MSGLNKQVIPISLLGGLDTKTDEKQVVPGKLIRLENAVFTTLKSLRKRNGFDLKSKIISNPPTSTTTISSGKALTAYLDELLLADNTSLYSYDAGASAWTYRSPFVSVNVTQQSVIRDTYQQSQQDEVAHAATGLRLVAWEDSRGGSWYQVIDGTTGQLVKKPTQISATAIKPKTVTIGNFLVLFWMDTATSPYVLYNAAISVANPTAALSPAAVTAGSSYQCLDATLPNYDVTVSNGLNGYQMYVVINSNNSSITTISFGTPATWQASTAVVVGQIVRNGPNIYICTTGGTTSAGPGPTGTGTGISDGSGSPVVWNWVAAAGSALQTPIAIAEYAGLSGGNALTVFGDQYGDGGPCIAYYDGTNVGLYTYTPNLAVILTNTVMDTVANVVSITGVSVRSDYRDLRIYWTISSALTYNYLVRTQHVYGTPAAPDAYNFSGASVWTRSVGLAGKAFSTNNTAYVPAAYQSATNNSTTIPNQQSSYFVIDDGGNIISRVLYGLGGGLPNRSDSLAVTLAESSPTQPNSTDAWLVSFLVKDLLTTQFATTNPSDLTNSPVYIYSQNGITSMVFDFADPVDSYLHGQLGNTIHFGGGFLSMYDGGPSVVEHGFHLFPDSPPTPVITTTGGSLSQGQYQYVFTYEWQDQLGQTHRSAPSAPITVTTANATSKVTFHVPTLRLTAKQGVRTPPVIVCYRTAIVSGVPGTTFFQATTTTTPGSVSATNAPILNVANGSGVPNTLGQDYVSFLDNMTDVALQARPQLYTLGNVLENNEPNPTSAVTVHQNRLIALDSTNPLTLWYSKECVPGTPVEFSAGLFLNIDPRGGPITAIASMDDKLIVFKRDRIFMILGQGPDLTGAQNDYSNSIVITTAVGCINARSVVVVPNGLMFQSSKGIYTLTRGDTAEYTGADVEAYNNDTVTSAQLIPTTNQVRFTLDSGVTLCYDYFVNQWSVFTPIDAADSTVWADKFLYLNPDGGVWEETPGIYSDNGQYIKMRLTTSWMSFAGLNGFQRVYQFMILGQYISDHQLQVSVAYDFNPAYAQQDTITPIHGSAWGGDSVWGGDIAVSGDDTTWGGVFPQYEWRVFPNQPKCTTIQVTIEDIQSGNTVGESMSLSAVSFLAGIKRGLRRVGPGASY